MRTTATVLLVLALALSACAAEDGADQPTSSDPATSEAPEVDPSDDTDEVSSDPGDDDVATDDEPVTLTLLTHDSFDVSEDVLARFTEETGVEVRVAPSGDAGTALNQAILTRDAPQGDLLFGVDSNFLGRALDAELFVHYRSPLLEQVDDAYQLDPSFQVTPIDVGDVCLNHDVAWFDAADVPLPSDLAELTDPAYDDLLVVQNPATSSPGLAFMLATIARFGEDGWLDYWQDLVDRGVLVTDGWSEAYYDEFSGTGVGDRPLVVSYASSPPAEVYFADPQPDEAPTGVIEASCYRQIEFVGILDGTPHVEEAELLVDFLLDVPFQEDLPLTMFVFPVNEQAALPEVFEQHAVVPDEVLELDPALVAERRDGWIDAWTEVVLR